MVGIYYLQLSNYFT